MPMAIEAISSTEGPTEGIANQRGKELTRRRSRAHRQSYAIPHRRIAQDFVKQSAMIGYWRSVGNSMNDFFYESFLDELADAGGQDPLALRLHLLRDNARLTTLLKAAVELSGGWKRGPYWPRTAAAEHAASPWPRPSVPRPLPSPRSRSKAGRCVSTNCGRQSILGASSIRPSSMRR
jgi:hypothetical protein